MPSSDLLEKFDQYYRMLYTFFVFRGESSDDANDLASEAMERALNRLYLYDSSKGSVKTWLLAIGRNTSINAWKRNKKFDLPLEDPRTIQNQLFVERGGEEQALIAEERARLRIELQKLDAREREILALKFAARMTNREIARLSGYSESNIGVILYRAIHKLRDGMTEVDVEVRRG